MERKTCQHEVNAQDLTDELRARYPAHQTTINIIVAGHNASVTTRFHSSSRELRDATAANILDIASAYNPSDTQRTDNEAALDGIPIFTCALIFLFQNANSIGSRLIN